MHGDATCAAAGRRRHGGDRPFGIIAHAAASGAGPGSGRHSTHRRRLLRQLDGWSQGAGRGFRRYCAAGFRGSWAVRLRRRSDAHQPRRPASAAQRAYALRDRLDLEGLHLGHVLRAAWTLRGHARLSPRRQVEDVARCGRYHAQESCRLSPGLRARQPRRRLSAAHHAQPAEPVRLPFALQAALPAGHLLRLFEPGLVAARDGDGQTGEPRHRGLRRALQRRASEILPRFWREQHAGLPPAPQAAAADRLHAPLRGAAAGEQLSTGTRCGLRLRRHRQHRRRHDAVPALQHGPPPRRLERPRAGLSADRRHADSALLRRWPGADDELRLVPRQGTNAGRRNNRAQQERRRCRLHLLDGICGLAGQRCALAPWRVRAEQQSGEHAPRKPHHPAAPARMKAAAHMKARRERVSYANHLHSDEPQSLWLVASSDGKPVSTFPENALNTSRSIDARCLPRYRSRRREHRCSTPRNKSRFPRSRRRPR